MTSFPNMSFTLRPRQTVDDTDDDSSLGYHFWPWLILVCLVLLLIGALSWFIYSTLRARRLGLPQPSLNPFSDRNRIPSRNYPARPGPLGWIKDKVRALGNLRTHGGAFEGGRAARRGFGRLDPDEAWDARVGNEADANGYYEEQELGLHDDSAPGYYGNGAHGYGPSGGLDEIVDPQRRGRADSKRVLDQRYDEEVNGGPRNPRDPFGDHAEASALRGVSPRPHEDAEGAGRSGVERGAGISPAERKSMFTEDV